MPDSETSPMQALSEPPEPLDYFLASLTVDPAVYYWCYDPAGHLLGYNHPEHVLHRVFEHTGCLQQALEFAAHRHTPLVVSARLGLVWGVVYQTDAQNALQKLWVLGPIFHSDSGSVRITEEIQKYEMEYASRQMIISAVQELSVIASPTFFRLLQMLHFYVTGVRIDRGVLSFRNDDSLGSAQSPEDQHNRIHTWQAERALLQMVRDGDIHYQGALERAGALSNGVPVRTDNPAQAATVSAITFTVLCTRAAIEGGLVPDEAYSVGDWYIQQLLSCQTVSGTRQLNHQMYEDFISRVHRLHLNPDISPEIQACIEYIDAHVEDTLSAQSVAKHFGYARTYLSRRFKEETGGKLIDYIHHARIERAKKLLQGTNLGVGEIAARLHFASSSHFSDNFKKLTGFLPSDYRHQLPGAHADI